MVERAYLWRCWSLVRPNICIPSIKWQSAPRNRVSNPTGLGLYCSEGELLL